MKRPRTRKTNKQTSGAKETIVTETIVTETNQNIMDKNFNNLSLIQLIYKWKWHLLIITAVAAICGGIFSGARFITPLYKSEAIAYPANISPYSDESETEQMLQIINSQSIADSIIEKYDLWSHYGIDRNYQYAKTYMMLEYHEKVKISKTPYDAISIVVNDKDPVMACNIVNDILYYYDKKVGKLHRDKERDVVVMYEKQLAMKQQGIDSLKREFSENGSNFDLVGFISQAGKGGKGQGADPQTLDLATKIITEGMNYAVVHLEYEKELRFMISDLSYSNIITEPYPADKKSYPIRWVVVTLSALGALLVSILVLFIIENRKRFVPAEK